ncbi:MAG: ROK family glucokinase [Lachnospiraceae bacterium]|nr:ROK family glucokinase [Lachnospiraceae bacterium]
MSQTVFGVDIGGTTVKIGLFDTAGELLEKWEIPTRTENKGAEILPDVAKSIQEKMKERGLERNDVAGVGIGVPGPVDGEGIVHRAVNLGWGEFSVKEELSGILKMPVMAGNDANVAALGEMWKGGAQGYSNVVLVTLGTGVGGGILINGHILSGSTGAGGEIGHIHIEDHETENCGCGNKGCLEQYASATGITRIANRILKESTDPSLLRDGEVSAKTVFDAVKQNDALAIRVAKEFGRYLGDGLAAIACVVNPEVFCIGGGVSKAGPVLLDYIRPSFLEHVFHGSRGTGFVLATLGNDAGIYGAARLLLDN